MTRLIVASILVWSAAGLMAFEAAAPDKSGTDATPAADGVPAVTYETRRIPGPDPAHATTIAARPLFSPSRRPPAAAIPAVVQAAEAAPTDPGLRLRGVGGRTGSLAAYVSNADGDVQLRAAGDRIEGWEVVTVGPDAVELRRGEASLVLRFPGPGEDAQRPRAVRKDVGEGNAPAPDTMFTGGVDN